MSEEKHIHDHDCDCGYEDDELKTMTLTLDDDTEVECGILGVFDADDKSYIALLPLEDETALIYEYNENENGEVDLGLIEDDDVFEQVTNTFYELWDDGSEEEDEDE